MSGPPTGTVTFLFTDIESSTRLWEQDAPAMHKALARHDEIVRDAIAWHGGYIFKTIGDAFCATFPNATDALKAALCTQRALCAETWPEEIDALRVRMALHTGAVEERGGDYFGPPLNRVTRLLSAGHGGQTLLSLATQELVRDKLPEGTGLRDLGERRLKDLFRPERVFQLVVPDLPASFPPLRTLDARLSNLPVQPTALVGREREVAEVCGLLRREEVRLLTLTGPGGTGKTRLGLQAAAELLDELESGVYFAPLAAVTDPDLVLSEVATALGVRETGELSVAESLKEYLRLKKMLLVVDNFEQVLGGAPAVMELLSAAPGVKVLTTSRILLGVYGEHEYAVPPLSVPDPKRLPSVEALSQYEAVRLFIERAGAAKAGFEITYENAPPIAEICARLDGLPLAIELAAARIKLLPPKALLTRLANRLKILTGGAKNLPARQRTLRGAIEWSYDLLDEGEKTLFSRLSVFSGGRTLEAIEAICDAGGDLPMDALDGVSSLLDKSLLRSEEALEDEPRFVMLETIHEYSREKLEESGEAAEIKRVHAEYFLALAEEAEPELKGPRQQDWLDRLDAEHDNLRAALSWALKSGDPDLALTLAGVLGWFWYVRGHLSEGTGWLERALSSSGGGAPGPRAKALYALGWMVGWQGDCERAETLSAESLALHREMRDVSGIAGNLSSLGWTAMLKGDTERAPRLLEESMALAREVGEDHLMSRALQGLAWLACEQGDLRRSDALLEESLTLSRKRGDIREVANSLHDLGLNSIYQGDHERAAALVEETLALRQRMGDRMGTAAGLSVLGMAALGRGDTEAAKSFIVESLTLCSELGHKPLTAENLEVLAGVNGVQGEETRVARLWGAAEALRESLGVPLSPSESTLHDSYLAAARSRLGEEAWEVAQAEGRTMTLDEAVAYALDREE